MKITKNNKKLLDIIDVSKTYEPIEAIKILKEKDNTINDCKKRIKHLENQILKKQSRTKYIDSKFVVYIITNKHKKKEHIQ